MSGADAGQAAAKAPRPCWREWRSRFWRRASLLCKQLSNRDSAIAKVSEWIQTSVEAWTNCYIAITAMVLAHLVVQTWLALPVHAEPSRWQACRRACLAQTGLVALAAAASLHVQVRGLAGRDGIMPFPRRAADRIRRSSSGVCLLDWESVWTDPAAWLVRCANVIESRWWARGCAAAALKEPGWWQQSDSGLEDCKLTRLCWSAEVASALVVVTCLLEGRACGVGPPGVCAEAILGLLRTASLVVAAFSYRALRACCDLFTALQWDSLLVEATLLAVPASLPLLPNCWLPALLLPHQVLAFRCMFGSGVVKRRSRCPRWASSTAMDLHYETQPIPHLGSWFAHKLPDWWHAQECWIAFLTQLPLTFLQWGSWHCRLVSFASYAALMGAITATGSYGFFNFQVLGLAVSILDDSLIPWAPPPACEPLPDWAAVALLPAALALGLWVAAAGGVALLQLPRMGDGHGFLKPASGTVAERALGVALRAHEAAKPLGIGHSYGPFAGMTTFRWELVFELSQDGQHWTELAFRYKPGRVDVPPRWMPLGHFARLDWRLWFVPLGMGRGHWELPEWVQNFILQLMRGSEQVAALTLDKDSIVASPPKLVRVSVWDYHFSSCNPAVHKCGQVSVTMEERDAAYSSTDSWWSRPSPRRSHAGRSSQADECTADPDSCACDMKDRTTEWGRWWYRRFVGRVGVFALQDGRLEMKQNCKRPF